MKGICQNNIIAAKTRKVSWLSYESINTYYIHMENKYSKVKCMSQRGPNVLLKNVEERQKRDYVV